MPTSNKKKFLFLRRLPPLPKGEWGGLEKLMFDWFERIDYSVNDVYIGVTTGWKARFLQEASHRKINVTIIEVPFEANDSSATRCQHMLTLTKDLNLSGIVFFQAHFAEFLIIELLIGSLKAKGNIFTHENLGPLKPLAKTSKRYFGIIPGFGLWWHMHRLSINKRSFIAKRILTVSKEIKQRYVSWWGYHQNKVKVLYHGVDTQHFSPDLLIRQKIRLTLGIPINDIVIITTGRFTEQKRLERAIIAFDEAYKTNKNIHLLLAGGGPLEKDLKDLACQLPSKERINFLGNLSDPADYLKASDIFILSSDNEGLSLALLEAMACRLICLSTNCTGSNEAITDTKTGFIVEISQEGITQGLKHILNLDSVNKSIISQQAVEAVRQQFDIDRNVQQALYLIGMARHDAHNRNNCDI